MNVYLDTSALVKLYVTENGSARVRDVVVAARLAGTSLLAYLEARSAFARRHREGDLTAQGYRAVVETFDGEWRGYYVTDVGERVVRSAALKAERNALRALDSLHLASAMALAESTGMPWTFLAADQRLVLAATAEGLEAIDVGPGQE